MTTLQEFLNTGVFAFLLCFVRIGTAAMIMPTIGDSFVPERIRLHMALGLSFVLFPMVMDRLPSPVPGGIMLYVLIGMEFTVGLLIGTIARILISALDTAGMIVSMASGLSNAQLFNPNFATQGSLMGALLSVSGVVVLFASNMHHILFYGLVGSYDMFPVGAVPSTGDMAELVARALAASFTVGFQIAAPFVVVSLMLYIGMGVLSRLMPQVQVFLLAIPVQIMLALLALGLVMSSIMLFWLERFQAGMTYFMTGGG